MDEKTFRLKASIDRKNKRVLLAECGKDFADILFSFLTMPLGSIVRLISHHPSFKLGCLSNLCNSVQKLDPRFVQNESCWAKLLNPQNSKAQSVGGMFIKGQPRFVVSDDLEVLPASTAACLNLLSRLRGIDSEKDEKYFTIGKDKVLVLLMLSLMSKTALTETLLQNGLREGDYGDVSIDKLRIFGSLFEENQKIRIRVGNSKSTKKVHFAEANGDFINLLFSFLTIPLGQMVKEIHYGGLSSVCITQLYKSVVNLDPNEYFKSYRHKQILLNPSFMNTIPLVLTEQRIKESRKCGGFVKREAMFSVSDHLRIGPISPVSYLSAISKSSPDGLRDIEINDVYVGRKEAFCLLVASVFSENALDEAFQVCLTTRGSEQPTTSIQPPPSNKGKTKKARCFCVTFRGV